MAMDMDTNSIPQWLRGSRRATHTHIKHSSSSVVPSALPPPSPPAKMTGPPDARGPPPSISQRMADPVRLGKEL